MAFAFEKLLVYQKAVDFADAVCDLTEQFPARYNQFDQEVIEWKTTVGFVDFGSASDKSFRLH